MQAGTVQIFDDRICTVGEGPLWDERSNQVLWVDILTNRVLWRGIDSGDTGEVQLPGHVGAILPTDRGDWLVCLPDGVYRTTLRGEDPILLARYPHRNPAAMRANDAKVSPAGQVFTGTMPYDPETHRGHGALYQMRGGQLSTVFTDVTISNGLGWSPDGAQMYFVDSPTGRVDVCDVHSSGEIDHRRELVKIPDVIGVPDGLTVDALGNIWVAIWGGGRIMVFDPSGQQLDEIPVPTPQTTSCAFVGPDLTSLLITTAALHLPDDPQAGRTFMTTVSVAGQPQPLVIS